MSLARRALTNSQDNAIVTSITSLLQALNPQSSNLSDLSSEPLNQFSPDLNPNLVIRVIKNQSNPYHGLFFFNWASNPSPNPCNYSHTFQCFAAITDLLLSHFLFSTASSLLLQSDKLSDSMIGRFIKAHGNRGDIRAAIDWFHRAKAIENGRCLSSYNAVLAVMVSANRINLAKAFYDQMMEENLVKPDVFTYTTMIRGFCKMGMVEHAQKMFDEMGCDPNSFTCNTLITGYCRKGDMESARGVFGFMMESKICLPDTVTYTTLIDGYSKKGEVGKAINLLKEMEERGIEPNVFTYNALIHGLCLIGDLHEAKRMITEMRLNGIKDDVGTHTTILKGLCITGKLDEAFAVLREMVFLGMNLDVKAYGVVLNECCRRRKPEEAISLLREMRVQGLNPHVSSFNAVLRSLGENGELDRASLLLKQMPKMGCSPNFVSYCTVICSLCGMKGMMQEVEELVHYMIHDGHIPDLALYCCLVKSYCEDGNVDKAMRVFNETLDRNYIINLDSFSALINALCAAGRHKEAITIFKDVSRRCSKLDRNTYKKVVDELLCKYLGEKKEEYLT
ncbi:hypothetical protein L484_003771 [Morus notabilis]|uniref:Pentatricopeptide repeat-containing protein n=1 Tax=Morus notabilis TaxID=981085 RepID=W9QXD2_9ROSA|nr:pentatricopeptide repeat-containing protein At5g65560 [Morus notabilis]EXB48288.1 hypothetical protein L484_003771 [Morus notabilis]